MTDLDIFAQLITTAGALALAGLVIMLVGLIKGRK